MIKFIQENWGTILISLLLVLIVLAIIRKLYRDRKRGQSCSSGHCSGCSASVYCHQVKESLPQHKEASEAGQDQP